METLGYGGTQIEEHGSIEVFEWNRSGQMERDFGFQLTNTSGDFQDAILQCTKLCVLPRGAL